MSRLWGLVQHSGVCLCVCVMCVHVCVCLCVCVCVCVCVLCVCGMCVVAALGHQASPLSNLPAYPSSTMCALCTPPPSCLPLTTHAVCTPPLRRAYVPELLPKFVALITEAERTQVGQGYGAACSLILHCVSLPQQPAAALYTSISVAPAPKAVHACMRVYSLQPRPPERPLPSLARIN